MKRAIKFTIVVLLFGVLASVRFFQDTLFYDPLVAFFRGAHNLKSLPQLDLPKIMMSTFSRYVINTLISLWIIWVLFKKREVLKVAILLFIGLLLVLIIPYYFLIQSEIIGNHLPLFYVRRFLIQPILLLILLPAFYFQIKK